MSSYTGKLKAGDVGLVDIIKSESPTYAPATVNTAYLKKADAQMAYLDISTEATSAVAWASVIEKPSDVDYGSI